MMKKKVLPILAILFSVVLSTAAFAQTQAPGDQGTQPGPGYGMGPGGGYGYGPGVGSHIVLIRDRKFFS